MICLIKKKQPIECDRRLKFLCRPAKILRVIDAFVPSPAIGVAKTSQPQLSRVLHSICSQIHASFRSSERNLQQLSRTPVCILYLPSSSSSRTFQPSFKKDCAYIQEPPCVCNVSLRTNLLSIMTLQQTRNGSSLPAPLSAWTLYQSR